MEVMWKIDQFSARSLTRISMACAKLGSCKAPMFDWVAARVVGRLDDYSPEDLSDVLWAFGEAGIKSEVLASAIAGRISKQSCREPTDEELGRMTQALSKLGAAPRGVLMPFYSQRLTS